MGPGRDPAHEDEALQKAGVAYLKHLVDAAAAMNAPTIAGPHIPPSAAPGRPAPSSGNGNWSAARAT